MDEVLRYSDVFQRVWMLLETEFRVDRLEAKVLRDAARLRVERDHRAFETPGELHTFFEDTLEWIRHPLAQVM